MNSHWDTDQRFCPGCMEGIAAEWDSSDNALDAFTSANTGTPNPFGKLV